MIIAVDILKFVLLVIITFFSCQVITNGNKRISYIGTLLICFCSAIIQYINSGLVEAILTGELIFVSTNNLLENKGNKFIFGIAIPVRNYRFLIAF